MLQRRIIFRLGCKDEFYFTLILISVNVLIIYADSWGKLERNVPQNSVEGWGGGVSNKNFQKKNFPWETLFCRS